MLVGTINKPSIIHIKKSITPQSSSGFWLVSLAVLLSIITLGMLPTRRSIETHTAKWASALALAQLAEARLAA